MPRLHPLLLVDCGNSAVKWQLVAAPAQGATIHPRWRDDVLHAPMHRIDNAGVVADALAAAWAAAWNEIAGDGPADRDSEADLRWSISWVSVGPDVVRDQVRHAFERIAQTQAAEPWTPVKSVGLQLPEIAFFDNGYADAQQLGADRWISALGLAAQGMMGAGETHMIVSAGTATTIDLLRCDANDASRVRFCGGWIFPGVQLMHSTLRSGTRDLQYDMDGHVAMDPAIPADSRSAIAQGIALAQTGAIGLLMRRHHVTKLWLHGGGALAWRSWLAAVGEEEGMSLTVHEQPQLAFAGLYAMARLRRSAG
jgi:pantothenate kinase type III